MIRYENHCCGCSVPAYPCIGDRCPNINVPVYYCDFCDNDTYAEYEIDGEHYCEECAETYLKEIFEESTILERAEMLDISIKNLEE